MSYASLADLLDRAGEDEILQVADRDGNGVADPDVIAAALVHGDNTIDGYLAVRFAVPLSSTPPIVITWAVAIARYHLHRDGAPEHVVRDYKDAIAALKDTARGAMGLPGVNGIAPDVSSDSSVIVAGPEPSFSAERLEGWL